MRLLTNTRTKLVLRSTISWQQMATSALARFVLSGVMLGVFYVSAVSQLIGEGQQTRLDCDRHRSSLIECELTQQDETGSVITTKILGLQAAKARPTPLPANFSSEAGCHIILVNQQGEKAISLGKTASSGSNRCTQAQRVEQRINHFVQNPTVPVLSLEEDNRHDPVPTWLIAGSIWGITTLLIALGPAVCAWTDTWDFDATEKRLYWTRRWLWRAQLKTYALSSLELVHVITDHDRWQRPRHAVHVALAASPSLIVVPKDYGAQHQRHCQQVSELIQDLLHQSQPGALPG